MSGRRSKLEIINDILRSIQDKRGKIKPTHLLYKSNLSHTKMKQYVQELIDKGMITVEHHKKARLYVITDTGLKFLEEFQRIRAFTESYGIEF